MHRTIYICALLLLHPGLGHSHESETVTTLTEFTVTERRPTTAATSEVIRTRDLELRPHSTTQEILNNLPGLPAGQQAGGGKAMQYFLRAFDNDHGTDIALFVDGVPVNVVSHAHGQGYADLNFLIPEIVDRGEFSKGPYFAEWGDLANAGTVNFVTKEDSAENSRQALGGFFETMRYTGVLSPTIGPVQTLLATEVYFSAGPFKNPENYSRYNLFGKFTIQPTDKSKLTLWASAHDGDWDASGQVPLREVRSGRLDRFDATDPTEGGKSDRQNANLIYTCTPNAQQSWFVQLSGGHYKLRLFSNFSFFASDPVRGDGIEQNDSRIFYGGRAHYDLLWTLAALPMQTTIGFETRNDDAHVGLFKQERQRRFATTNNVYIEERSFSGYLKQEIFLSKGIRLQVGLRGDFFTVDVNEHLPANAGDAIRIHGNTTDGIVSPKANLIIAPFQNMDTLWQNTEFFFNFGMGYHSNDARDAVQASSHPLARSTGGEVGTRTTLWEKLDLTDTDWRQTQFASESGVRRELGVDSRCPGEGITDIHFVPGLPIQLARWDYSILLSHVQNDKGLLAMETNADSDSMER